MLNAAQERELCYIVLIDKIEPIIGSDNCESAVVGGWHIMVRKEQFKPGDPAIYFEIDSKVPANKECFAFLEKRHYKVKTQKFTFGGKGNFISQGLLMHAEDFGWTLTSDSIIDDENNVHFAVGETRFLTKKLGVTYADDEDNSRKAPSVDKYKKMASRHQKLFKKPFIRWMMRHGWGRKVLFFLFGKKKDKKNGWPSWVQKTDEERIENMPFILNNKDPWIVTEKVDGSSCTFTMRKSKFGKRDFYVCSRNVCFDSIDKPCYYDTNVYWEMANKYHMYEVLSEIMNKMPNIEWVTIQGEVFGETIQKNTYDLGGRELRVFNLITSDKGRWNSCNMKAFLEEEYGVPCVPILDEVFILPDTVEELREYVNSTPSTINGKIKEGIVCRSLDGIHSFKCVSPEYLIKYHG